MQVLNVCGPSVSNLLPVTHLEPRIFKWLLHFFKTCVPWIKSPLYQVHFPPTSFSPPAWFMTIYHASHLFPAISSVYMHSAGRILLLPCTDQMMQILETEYVNILGCQLPVTLISTVSTTFYCSQYPLMLCTCSTISNTAFTFPLMKHKTPSAATLGAEKSVATCYFIHTQCVKWYRLHDLEKNKH